MEVHTSGVVFTHVASAVIDVLLTSHSSVTRVTQAVKAINSVIAEAVQTGVGAALVDVDFTAGTCKTLATSALEAQREEDEISLLHTLCPVIARINSLAGQQLAVQAFKWSQASAVVITRLVNARASILTGI